MKKVFSLLLVILLSNWAVAQITDYSIFDKKFNFYVANDLGRNGYYDQKPIAELMGTMAEEIRPRICSCHRRYTSFRRRTQRE